MLEKFNFNITESVKSVGKLTFGTIIGQLLSIISLPIFTRIYGPTVIGNWAFFNSIAVIMNSFSDLGLTNTIMVEKNEEEAEKLYSVISTISLIISLLTGICVFIYYTFFPSRVEMNVIFISIIIAIYMFTLQQTQVCYTWLNRRKEYNTLMKNPIINNIVVLIFATLFGIFGVGQYGYYIALLSGQLITLIYMKVYLPNNFFCFNFSIYKYIFKKNVHFMKYQTSSNIIIQMKSQTPVILMQVFFGPKILGYYSISVRLLNMPVTVLANALGKVFFQRASEIKNEGSDVGEFTLRTLNRAMKIAILPISVLLSSGDIIAVLLFGNDYVISGNILRIMVFYGFFLFLSMSVTGIAIVINKQKYMIFSGIAQMIGFSIGIWIGSVFFNSVYIATFLLGLSFIVIQIVYFSATFKTMNISLNRYYIPLIKNLGIICLIYIILRGIFLFLGVVNGL